MQLLLRQLCICVHGKAAELHKQQKKFREYLNSKPNFGGICVVMLYYSCIQDLFVQMNFKSNSKREKGGIAHFIVKFMLSYQTWYQIDIIWYM